jgi:hypothetical protein
MSLRISGKVIWSFLISEKEIRSFTRNRVGHSIRTIKFSATPVAATAASVVEPRKNGSTAPMTSTAASAAAISGPKTETAPVATADLNVPKAPIPNARTAAIATTGISGTFVAPEKLKLPTAPVDVADDSATASVEVSSFDRRGRRDGRKETGHARRHRCRGAPAMVKNSTLRRFHRSRIKKAPWIAAGPHKTF